MKGRSGIGPFGTVGHWGRLGGPSGRAREQAGRAFIVLGEAGSILSGSSGSRANPLPAPTSTGTPAPSAKIELTEKPVRPDNKRKVEGALTAAAIAAIIVQASRAISRKAVRLPG
jgi:hypothetical protein